MALATKEMWEIVLKPEHDLEGMRTMLADNCTIIDVSEDQQVIQVTDMSDNLFAIFNAFGVDLIKKDHVLSSDRAPALFHDLAVSFITSTESSKTKVDVGGIEVHYRSVNGWIKDFVNFLNANFDLGTAPQIEVGEEVLSYVLDEED